MKARILTLAAAVAAVALIGACSSPQPVDIDSMSLEKTSPFATPSPKPFTMNGGLYRETQYGMPAMIPHDVKNFRITKDSNPCMMCHADTAKIGAKKVKGEPVAMPETHWTTVDGKKVMHPSRYECLLCHAPQAEVERCINFFKRSDRQQRPGAGEDGLLSGLGPFCVFLPPFGLYNLRLKFL